MTDSVQRKSDITTLNKLEVVQTGELQGRKISKSSSKGDIHKSPQFMPKSESSSLMMTSVERHGKTDVPKSVQDILTGDDTDTSSSEASSVRSKYNLDEPSGIKNLIDDLRGIKSGKSFSQNELENVLEALSMSAPFLENTETSLLSSHLQELKRVHFRLLQLTSQPEKERTITIEQALQYATYLECASKDTTELVNAIKLVSQVATGLFQKIGLVKESETHALKTETGLPHSLFLTQKKGSVVLLEKFIAKGGQKRIEEALYIPHDVKELPVRAVLARTTDVKDGLQESAISQMLSGKPGHVKQYMVRQYKNNEMKDEVGVIYQGFDDSINKVEGKLTEDESLSVIHDLFEGLHEMHKLGIVHWDIKPGNALFKRDQSKIQSVLTDYGISFLLSTKPKSRGYGTPFYTPPENIQSKALQGHEKAADIWAMALSALEVTTFKESECEAVRTEFMKQLSENSGFDTWQNTIYKGGHPSSKLCQKAAVERSSLCKQLKADVKKLHHKFPDSAAVKRFMLLAKVLASAPKDRPTASQVMKILKQLS